MRRALIIIIGIILAGVACWVFPPFRIVPLQEARAVQQQKAFNAAEFAEGFWRDRLLSSLDQSAEAAEVLNAWAQDPKIAAERFGRRVGMGSAQFFFLRGTGTVVSVDRKGVGASLGGAESETDVVLPTGLIFGNAVRDSTGLLNVSEFPNSQHFNQISTELNRIVETQVIRSLKEEAEIGRRIEFVGCAEVGEGGGDVRPLTVIPVFVNVEN